MVPDRADTWTRMVYAGPEQADRADRRSVPDVRQALRPREGPGEPEERARRPAGRPEARSASAVSAEDRQLLDEHATFVREMEQELQAGGDETSATPCPSWSRASRKRTTTSRKISKMQIDLMVNSFAADFARVATLQYHQLGRRGADALAGHRRGAARAVAQAGQRRRRAGEADARSTSGTASSWPTWRKRLAETPEPGGGGSLLDNTLIVWTNELGKGNSHTLDNIPFVLVGNGLDFKMGRSLKYQRVPHNRLLLSLAHGFGHHIERFGNPDYLRRRAAERVDLKKAENRRKQRQQSKGKVTVLSLLSLLSSVHSPRCNVLDVFRAVPSTQY